MFFLKERKKIKDKKQLSTTNCLLTAIMCCIRRKRGGVSHALIREEKKPAIFFKIKKALLSTKGLKYPFMILE